jgi:hypothetical protein
MMKKEESKPLAVAGKQNGSKNDYSPRLPALK